MVTKDDLIDVFEDTKQWYETDKNLKQTVANSIRNTVVFKEDNYPDYKATNEKNAEIRITKYKTLEAAYRLDEEFPKSKICILNFASATNAGGGVTKGSRAQEECLCRTTTLYPVLNTRNNYKDFYNFHRNRHDLKYTDTCIYTPGIVAIKSDSTIPQRYDKEDWLKLDVISCPAPNLRVNPSNYMNKTTGKAIKLTDNELLELHKKRGKHILSVVASYNVDILVLGAFGCGAFQNNPSIVAKAYYDILPEFKNCFKVIEFAIYCTERDTKNYFAFYNLLSKLKF